MEVFSQSENSEVFAKQFKLFCLPCCIDGQHAEANGFCQNCKEYLCSTCIKYHRKVRLSKNHMILDKQNMPTNVRKALTSVCTETCEKHSTEVLKYFCTQHETVGCADCMVLEHKPCKVDYIPDITEEFLKGNEFSALVYEISRLKSIVKLTHEDIEKIQSEADKNCLETVSDIRTFRKEINDHLDRMEKQLLDRCDTIKQDNTNKVKKMSEDVKGIAKELAIIQAQLTSQTVQSTDLFVKAKQARLTLKTLEDQQLEADRRSTIEMCSLKRSHVINSLVSKCSQLGDIEVRNITQLPEKMKTKRSIVNATPKQEGNITIKSSTDKLDCCISSIIALNDSTLACTDWYNDKVKLIEIPHDTLSSEIVVEPQPWDLTLIPDQKIAVTLTTAGKIQFLSFKQGLSKGRFIQVNGKCRGLAYTQNRLIVSYDGEPKVEVLSLQGEILHSITTNKTGGALFRYPLYIAVSIGEMIYVSDSLVNSVIKLTLDGQVLATYKDSELQDPRQVVCKDDYMLVCSFSKSNVQLVSPEGKQPKILLETKDGVDLCMSLCYVEDTNMMYLSNYNSRNHIQIYKFT